MQYFSLQRFVPRDGPNLREPIGKIANFKVLIRKTLKCGFCLGVYENELFGFPRFHLKEEI